MKKTAAFPVDENGNVGISLTGIYFESFGRGTPGSLMKLYLHVLDLLKAGHSVPGDVLVALLEATPPNHKGRNELEVRVLDEILEIQAEQARGYDDDPRFYAFKPAVEEWHRRLLEKPTDERNQIERELAVKSSEDAWRHLKKRYDRLR